MNILVSACFLGLRCRYDGQSKPNAAVFALRQAHTLVPVCPEQLGGLPTPRVPAERRGERFVNAAGADVTEAYRRGAAEAVKLAEALGCHFAVLKERSPACGCGEIYDGSFTHTLIPGDGAAAEALKRAGVTVVGESGAGAFFAEKSANLNIPDASGAE